MCDIRISCRYIAYVISLCLARYIVLWHVFAYVKFHFVTLLLLYIMFRSHFDLFAMIAFHVSNLFFDSCWHAMFQRHYERSLGLTKEFVALWKNSQPYERIQGHTKELATPHYKYATSPNRVRTMSILQPRATICIFMFLPSRVNNFSIILHEFSSNLFSWLD